MVPHADDDGSIEGGGGVSVAASSEAVPAGGPPGRGRDRTRAAERRENGVRTNPVRQPAPPASAGDVAGTLRKVRELSRFAEQELHAVILACTRARQHRLATSTMTKPTIH